MRLTPLLLSALLLTACKPSEMLGPDSRHDELDGCAETTEPVAGIYPSGTWEDGLGGAWNITVTGAQLSGEAASDNLQGLQMTGTIAGNMLTYDIGFPDQAPIGHGTAHLTDDDHAQFRTLAADGTTNAHGLLHFNHPAFEPAGPPMDLRPQPESADPAPQGD